MLVLGAFRKGVPRFPTAVQRSHSDKPSLLSEKRDQQFFNKTMRTNRSSHAMQCALVVLLASSALVAGQDFSFDWSSVTGGGGQSSGGDFTLDATIGQPEAGAMSGGDFELSGGLWSMVTSLENLGAPSLSLTVTGAQVVLSWPAGNGFGFALEETVALAIPPSATIWSNLNQTPQHTNGVLSVQLPMASSNRFYRLHRL
jgi:hypothetical protein